MIRNAVPGDIPRIVELGVEALSIDPYPELLISREKVFNIARECVSSAQHFAWVSEHNDQLCGALVALVTPLLLHERSQAMVVMWYCNKPGDGVRLMREFLKWARSRRAIKLIEYTSERNADPRIGRALEYLGLKQSLPIYIEVR
jgi:hypothetical protein